MERTKLFKILGGIGLIGAMGLVILNGKSISTSNTVEVEKIEVEDLTDGEKHILLDKEDGKYLFSNVEDKNLYILDEKTNVVELVAEISHKNYSIIKGEIEKDRIVYTEMVDRENNELDMPKKRMMDYTSAIYISNDSEEGYAKDIIPIVEGQVEDDIPLFDISENNIVVLNQGEKDNITFMDLVSGRGYGLFEEELESGYINNLMVDGNKIIFTVVGDKEKTYIYDVTMEGNIRMSAEKIYETEEIQVIGLQDEKLYALSKEGLIEINIKDNSRKVLMEQKKYNIQHSNAKLIDGKIVISAYRLIDESNPTEFVGYIDLESKTVTEFEKGYRVEKIFDDSVLLAKGTGFHKDIEYKIEKLK